MACLHRKHLPWHMHPKENCLDARLPKSNTTYWTPKLARNVARDAEHLAKLEALGWKSLVIWECETADAGAVSRRITRFLGP